MKRWSLDPTSVHFHLFLRLFLEYSFKTLTFEIQITNLNVLNLAEEVRVELINLLDLCLETDSTQFVPNLGSICVMMGRALQDQNPEMKIAGGLLAGKICIALKNNAGGYMKGVIEAMIGNLAHQHSKVRK